MEEISGCDSTSSNAIQAGLACPWRFLTAARCLRGWAARPDASPCHMGRDGEDSCCPWWAGVRTKGCGTS